MRLPKLSFALVFLAACTVGDVTGQGPGPSTGGGDDSGDPAPQTGTQQAPGAQPVDTDGDGIPDGIDLDGDGVPDISIDLPFDCNPLLDADGDGLPDGIDLDCDGAADVQLCPEPLVDEDGDGTPDGVDLDCDGAADIDLGDVLGGGGDVCIPQPVDEDGDGLCDGIDIDCDGTADITF